MTTSSPIAKLWKIIDEYNQLHKQNTLNIFPGAPTVIQVGQYVAQCYPERKERINRLIDIIQMQSTVEYLYK